MYQMLIILFYSNLNLESCLWEFNGYFNMSELVSVCGGRIGADGQVKSQSKQFIPWHKETN